jgi:hypothetical protein
MCLSAALFLAALGYADEFEKEQAFYSALCEPIDKFVESKKYEETRVPDSNTFYYRSQDTIVVSELAQDWDGEYTIAFITKDKNLKFPANIKFGGAIDPVVKSGQIPGKHSKQNGRSPGTVYYIWEHSELQKRVTIRTENGVIAEVTFYNRGEAAQGIEIAAEQLYYLSEKPASRQPVQTEDFFKIMYKLQGKFTDSKDYKTTRTTQKGELYKGKPDDIAGTIDYCQGVDNMAVLWNEMSNSQSLVFFNTRDTKETFPGGVKVGGPIDSALKQGLIPGSFSKKIGNAPNTEIYQWYQSEYAVLSIMTVNGKITEIGVANPNMIQYITPKGELLDFLEPSGRAVKQPQPEQKQAAQPSKQPALKSQQTTQKSDLNTSTDSKVINSYPLSTKDKNALSIQHRAAYNAYSKKSYKKAFEAFSKLADEYEGNYLSAYWAGVSALKLNKKQDAAAWFDRALAINPSYQPALDARGKLK